MTGWGMKHRKVVNVKNELLKCAEQLKMYAGRITRSVYNGAPVASRIQGIGQEISVVPSPVSLEVSFVQ